MNSQNPIYTELTRCQDCYKCVRACPVKAIRVEGESAAVEAERCIYCGTCVNVCPVGAKKVRDDFGRARVLLRRRPKVAVSLAPSWVTEWPGLRIGQMAKALRLLGFSTVSETALGAEEVSAACGGLLERAGRGVFLSTACPAAVDFVRKYRPELAEHLVPYLSPMLAHARLLRAELGRELGVVFIGPCVAKKTEADAYPDLVDVALTFPSLHRWFEDMGIVPAALQEEPGDLFWPRRAGQGVLYPVDGGMARGIRASGRGAGASFLCYSGMSAIQHALEGLQGAVPEPPLFLELLACEGGCVNGPRSTHGCTALKHLAVQRSLDASLPAPRVPQADLRVAYAADALHLPEFPEAELLKALRRLGKTEPEHELNCGGCGYDTCRKLAAALLEGRAEPSMCVSYMRQLAMNKANALIRAMPSGLVIVDEKLDIVECNRHFAEILGGDSLTVYDARPGMGGASLPKVAPQLRPIFEDALEMEEEVLRRDLRLGERLVRLTAFPVERERQVGAILHDITEPAFQREQIIQKAEEVIRKNVTTVQQIAYLLGENAAETEMILDGIIRSFRMAPPGPERTES